MCCDINVIESFPKRDSLTFVSALTAMTLLIMVE